MPGSVSPEDVGCLPRARDGAYPELVRSARDGGELGELAWSDREDHAAHDAHDGYSIDLQGDLGALLSLATGSTASKVQGTSGRPDSQAIDIFSEVILVAGVGFEPTTFRL